MTAIIWILPNCPNCVKEKEILLAEGYEIEERDGEQLVKAPRRDEVDALAQLSEQNGAFPIVKAGGTFRRPWKLSKEPKPGEWA